MAMHEECLDEALRKLRNIRDFAYKVADDISYDESIRLDACRVYLDASRTIRELV